MDGFLVALASSSISQFRDVLREKSLSKPYASALLRDVIALREGACFRLIFLLICSTH